MEFRFRAGDEPPPPSNPPPPFPSSSCDGYFTAQAMRAGLLNHGGGWMTPPLPPFPMTAAEAWERELRKERIRGEIIQEELIRVEMERRVLEEEVRWEMEMEGLFGRRRWMPPPPPPSQFDEEFRFRDGFGIMGRMGGGGGGRFENRMMLLDGPTSRIICREEEKIPVAAAALVRPKLEIKEIEPSGEPEGPPPPPQETKVAGVKRKAGESSGSTIQQKPKKPAQDWSCAVCQVSATSEAGLNEHLQGKKHKAKLVQSGVIKLTTNVKDGSKTTAGSNPSTASNVAFKKINIRVDGEMHQVVQRNDYLWCERCRVRCDNNVTMAGHLKGKKHKDSKVWMPIKAMRAMAKKAEDATTTRAEDKANDKAKGTASSVDESKESGEAKEASTDKATVPPQP